MVRLFDVVGPYSMATSACNPVTYAALQSIVAQFQLARLHDSTMSCQRTVPEATTTRTDPWVFAARRLLIRVMTTLNSGTELLALLLHQRQPQQSTHLQLQQHLR